MQWSLSPKMFYFYFVYLLIYYFPLCWVFIALLRNALDVASGSAPSGQLPGFSLWGLLLLQSAGSRHVGFSRCSAQAQFLCSMWNLPQPAVEPVAPALAGRFFFFTLQPWTLLFEYLQLLFYTQMLISYKTLYSILLGPFTLHFMPHFHQELFPQITICLIVYCCSVAKLYPTLCNAVNCSLPSSSIHEISQARILEWVAISFSISYPFLHCDFL